MNRVVVLSSGAGDEPAVVRRFAEGAAKRLFDRWRPLCAAPISPSPPTRKPASLPRPEAR